MLLTYFSTSTNEQLILVAREALKKERIIFKKNCIVLMNIFSKSKFKCNKLYAMPPYQ